jgi:hypothetical protein
MLCTKMCAHQLQNPDKCVKQEKCEEQENLVQKQDSRAEILGVIREMVEMEAECEWEMSQRFRRNMNRQRNRKLMASPHGEEDIEIIEGIE